MLRLENIYKKYEIRKGMYQEVLKDLSVVFPSCGFVSILGNSGSGKTTLLNIIGGIDRHDSGYIYFHDKLVEDHESFRRDHVGFVFQDDNLVAHLNAVDNVILSMTDENRNKKQRAKEILDDFGLADSYHKKPHQMSGGQRQRVAIVRMVAKNVDVIVCDEPTGNLDEESAIKIVELIKALAKDKLVIFVTHNKEIAREYSDRVLEIKKGTLVDDGISYDESEDREISRRSYNTNTTWLSIKNLMGRYVHTIRNIAILTFIMLLAALTIIMEGEFFRQYILTQTIDEGIKTIVYNLEDGAKYDAIRPMFDGIEYIEHISRGYYYKIDIAATNYVQTGAISRTTIEYLEGNEYLEEILLVGRMPESSDEVLMSGNGAMTLLASLNIGGQRLLDQYLTGGFTSDYVYSIVDDKVFIIEEQGYPRIKVVGLLDDNYIFETFQTIYFKDGFTELYDNYRTTVPTKFILYKDNLFQYANDSIVEAAKDIPGIEIDGKHAERTDVAYKTIESFIELSKLSLYLIITIAGVSFVSLLFNSIYERKYEIGLYRSKGYSRGNITKILGLEMFFNAFVSLVLVVGVLAVFALLIADNMDYVASFSEAIRMIRIEEITFTLLTIVSVVVTIIVVIGNRAILRKSILSNIKEL